MERSICRSGKRRTDTTDGTHFPWGKPSERDSESDGASDFSASQLDIFVVTGHWKGGSGRDMELDDVFDTLRGQG